MRSVERGLLPLFVEACSWEGAPSGAVRAGGVAQPPTTENGLPIYYGMTDDDVGDVVDALLTIVRDDAPGAARR